MPQDIPAFKSSDLYRWYPDSDGLVIAERELWAWVANSYRLRGCSLIRCVTEANNALRHAHKSNVLHAEMLKKYWAKRKRRKKVGRKAKPPSGRTAAAISLANHRRRAARIAEELRLKRAAGRAFNGGVGTGG